MLNIESFRRLFAMLLMFGAARPLFAQAPSDAERAAIQQKLAQLQTQIEPLRKTVSDPRLLADVEICAKGGEWILRHNEFFKPDYVKKTQAVLDAGLKRAEALRQQKSPWLNVVGQSTVLAYRSAVDDSVQPFSVTVPKSYDAKAKKRWPLHVVLHGRDANLNEVSFFSGHDGKTQKDEAPWIQLDVYGRTNNAYRWSGEADVFEALATTRKLFLIDDDRVTLWGFSMGGAGAWHLGLHHPDRWSSVGGGAGFVDTVHHLSLKDPLPPLSARLIHIYDAQDYALNAADVPMIGYGGELDKQLFAAKTIHEKTKPLGIDVPLLIGEKTEHKWHPDRQKEFMAFHAKHTQTGRLKGGERKKIRFITHTLKYNRCDWLTIDELETPYNASVVEAEIVDSSGLVKVTTQNIAAFTIAEGIAKEVQIDGAAKLAVKTNSPATFVKAASGWTLLSESARSEFAKNSSLHKRHDLQGPIDDAFMSPFVIVVGTGTPWSDKHQEWTNFTRNRFEHEYDKWLRAKPVVLKDTEVTSEIIASKHLILFGDPGSNSVMAKVIPELPVTWTKTGFEIARKNYDTKTHGLCLIHPNPLNKSRYVVLNSGHTFHETEFKASNAALYPRLGDVAVMRFERDAKDSTKMGESPVWADVFNSHWKLDPK